MRSQRPDSGLSNKAPRRKQRGINCTLTIRWLSASLRPKGRGIKPTEIKTTKAAPREHPDKRELELVLFDYNHPEFWLRKVSSLPNTPFLKAPLTAVPRDIGKRTVTTLIIAGLYDFIMKVAGQGKLPSYPLCVMHSLAADSFLRKSCLKKEAYPIITRPSLRRE